MKNKFFISAFLLTISALSPSANAAISIDSSNLVGFDGSTSAIVDNAGNAIANGSGFISVGSFIGATTQQIQSFSTPAEFNANFTALASTSMGQGVAMDGLWQTSFKNTGDTSALAGQSIFTVVGNGRDILSSTQFLVYQHTNLNGTGLFVEDPGNNGDATVANGSSSTGTILVGGHGNFKHDFGAGSFDAYNLATLIPEPSSTALLGLASLALMFRRKR